jgi:peptidoglycan glycosyltransferase
MSRRLSVLASIILLLFVVVAAQSAYVQYFRAGALNASPLNPRVSSVSTSAPRGQILAADGTILADSLPLGASGKAYQREYPLGALTAGVVGFVAPALGTTWGLEEQYNTELTAHAQPAQNFEQVLAPTSSSDNVQTTLYPALQKIAKVAMLGQDGAAVVIQPQTGAVMAMYSNPNYEPEYLASPSYTKALAYYKKIAKNDANGFPPLGLLATQQAFPPGSTFKVITTAAAAVYQPALLTKVYPRNTNFYLPPQTNHKIYNSGFGDCGGTVQQMLPASCDPGYAHMGVDLGAVALNKEASAFGYNSQPPIDLPIGRPQVSTAIFPSAASLKYNIPFVAYSAIGQGNVRSTALQQALEASAIADGGTIMTPHLMQSIVGPDGTVVSKYANSVWKTPLTSAQAGIIVPLMRNVVLNGTAYGIFLPQDEVAAKTGTAQERNNTETDDWMIAFAPASHPTVAVAVVMPFQALSTYGATVAGPIVKCLIEGALAIQAGQPSTGTSTTCAS